ncbi:MAG: MFS transporter [Burkholderiales bacterium]|nr:MFS transporter [Burkholderiales bacterium]
MRSTAALPIAGTKLPLDRVLSLFADVHRGESARLLLLAFNVFLILTAYYVMKPVREALILAQPDGAQIKSYSMALQAVLLVAIVPAYGALAARLPRRRLINTVTAFFTACLPLLYLAAEAGWHVGVVFFLWIGIFSLMVIAQFWAYANDLYAPEAGKRLFAVIAFGASLGAVCGAFIAGRLIGLLGVHALLLVAAMILGLSLAAFNWIDARERALKATTGPAGRQRGDDAPIGGANAFALVLRSRYLLLIGAMVLLLNWVNATGEFILSSIVQRAAEERVAAGSLAPERAGAFIGAFYAEYFQVVNIVGMLVQLFVVSRIIKLVGVHVAVCVLPVVALGSYAVAALLPSLAVVRWIKTAENSVDYSLQNTVRQMLFLPTTREEKYKAKQVTDSFIVRAGDVLSSATVFLGTAVLALGTTQFAWINVALVIVWLVVAFLVGREFRRRATPSAEGRT